MTETLTHQPITERVPLVYWERSETDDDDAYIVAIMGEAGEVGLRGLQGEPGLQGDRGLQGTVGPQEPVGKIILKGDPKGEQGCWNTGTGTEDWI